MKLSVKALALTMGALWGAAVLRVGVGYIATGSYGRQFMEFLSSIYPAEPFGVRRLCFTLSGAEWAPPRNSEALLRGRSTH